MLLRWVGANIFSIARKCTNLPQCPINKILNLKGSVRSFLDHEKAFENNWKPFKPFELARLLNIEALFRLVEDLTLLQSHCCHKPGLLLTNYSVGKKQRKITHNYLCIQYLLCREKRCCNACWESDVLSIWSLQPGMGTTFFKFSNATLHKTGT